MSVRLIADEGLTAGLARMMAAGLVPGDTVLLDGPVGAGKTHFARALIRARQGDLAEDVPSPTFTLVQTYDDSMGTEIWHADLYRLTDPSELDELGLDEAMSDAICLIEWPDRLEALPDGAMTIAIGPAPDPDLRVIDLAFAGADRIAQRAAFVAQAGWSDARVAVLAGDASARSFFRLRRGDESAVLMDDAAGDIAPFLRMTDWLRERGLGAPAIIAHDPDLRLMLVEDLGDDLVARVLADQPDLDAVIHDRITDLLVQIQSHVPPLFVDPLDGTAMADLTALFVECYPGADAAPDLPAIVARLHDDLAGGPPVLSLRDFHAENLIWRGPAPLGLIDYQDAVAAHPAYDLVSALQDARRDVAPETEARQIDRFLAATGHDPDAFRAAYALIGAQRALRILGVFCRLALRDGKTRYLDFMPRVWANLQRDLDHPALADLARVLQPVAAPTPDFVERIRARCQP
ncbi:tRNA (adenosine(37)-N6)-threonylcarbamoyltransferase complex ATPase subunit type 1 TsaE [Paracoccus zeaxanthinifaciens]|uniref:tRNA (adenosine(37)-N6)-threonylcarbamoyltransferase complex ATPase subunit type 1 TsaE n=1 Tax=Paracoccus zeaxanthinifaciens TaxID=187400 RepID=UPI0003B31724|nr:tRNA (adenosine(37)-N6)-threonylcarbamoyltransferase complex ATPase subunit type 1 TsaE [Paracoccus zeaxanthinifaciens]